jgi:hypothetical protein
MIFFSMIGDEKFFREVPAFAYMGPAATNIHREITEAIVNGNRSCRGCSNVRKTVKPLFMLFVSGIRKLLVERPEDLEALVTYIASRRGYRPVPIRIYFKAQGKVQSLEL